MTYRNTPFPEEAELFPRASTVCEYIQAYARSHGVHNHILFGVTVTRVRKTGQVGNWIVTSRRGIDVEEREDEFDFVAIANGHYEKVMIPTIPGLQ
jgi:dimethylaniline monooxygenase (N-oxide forming)